jgi:hypothetical protein
MSACRLTGLSQRLWTIARAFSCGFRFGWSSWMLPAVRCVAGAPCGAPSGARLLAMFIGYPWYVLQYLHAMPPRHAAMRTPQRTCTLLGPCGLVGRGPLDRRGRSLSRAPRLNHPRATAPSRQGQGVGVARGVEGVSVCGLIWFDGMRALGLARRVSGAAVCRLFSAAPAPVGRYLLITLCDYFITLETRPSNSILCHYRRYAARGTEFPANIYARVYSHIYHSYGGHCSSSNTALFPLSCT